MLLASIQAITIFILYPIHMEWWRLDSYLIFYFEHNTHITFNHVNSYWNEAKNFDEKKEMEKKDEYNRIDYSIFEPMRHI